MQIYVVSAPGEHSLKGKRTVKRHQHIFNAKLSIRYHALLQLYTIYTSNCSINFDPLKSRIVTNSNDYLSKL